MAGRAQLRFLDVRGRLRREPACRQHDPPQTVVHVERPENLRFSARADHEVAVEARFLAEVVGPDLVAGGAGHAVEREHRVGVALPRGLEGVKHVAEAALGPGQHARHRHVTGRADVFNFRLRAGMIRDLAAHTRLPVRIARRMRHHGPAPDMADGDVVSIRVGQIAVAGDALIGRCKRAVIDRLRRRRCARKAEDQAGRGPGDARCSAVAPTERRQPSNRPTLPRREVRRCPA